MHGALRVPGAVHLFAEPPHVLQFLSTGRLRADPLLKDETGRTLGFRILGSGFRVLNAPNATCNQNRVVVCDRDMWALVSY